MRELAKRVGPQRSATRLILITGLLLIFIAFFFFWRLGSITPGLGPAEYASRQNTQSIDQIITRGINAPYHLTQYLLVNLLNDSPFVLRLTSVVLALVISIFLMWLFRSWFGQAIALFGVLIFITTPWLVVTARTAAPYIMYLWPIILLACFVLMSRSKQRAGTWWIILCLTTALGLYVPGVIWLVLAAVIPIRRALLKTLGTVNGVYIVLGMTAALLLIAPLLISLALEPSRIKQLLLIPREWQSGIEIIKSIGWSAASFFWQTKSLVDISLHRLPILSILQIVLMVFGLYALSSRARSVSLSLIGMLLFSILASGVNDDPHLLILGLPAAAVLIAAGLRYLYIEWRRIFPFNPFAYGLAISLISFVVGAHLFYAARYSLIAWPQSDETKSTYVLK